MGGKAEAIGWAIFSIDEVTAIHAYIDRELPPVKKINESIFYAWNIHLVTEPQ